MRKRPQYYGNDGSCRANLTRRPKWATTVVPTPYLSKQWATPYFAGCTPNYADGDAQMKNTALLDWWREANAILETVTGYDDALLAGNARNWFAEGLTPAEAAQRQLENLNAAQEERSHYDR